MPAFHALSAGSGGILHHDPLPPTGCQAKPAVSLHGEDLTPEQVPGAWDGRQLSVASRRVVEFVLDTVRVSAWS